MFLAGHIMNKAQGDEYHEHVLPTMSYDVRGYLSARITLCHGFLHLHELPHFPQLLSHLH